MTHTVYTESLFVTYKTSIFKNRISEVYIYQLIAAYMFENHITSPNYTPTAIPTLTPKELLHFFYSLPLPPCSPQPPISPIFIIKSPLKFIPPIS